MQLAHLADSLALLKAGSNSPASIAIIAITTSNSINVNARKMSLVLRGRGNI